VLVKIEMNVSGSSRKGRDSLSPQLVMKVFGVFRLVFRVFMTANTA